MSPFTVRPLCLNEASYLVEFLCIAAHEDDIQAVKSNLNLLRYVESWGRPGDCVVVAMGTNSQLLGCAWARLWNAGDAGFGFVDEATPEIAIAVREQWQGQGIGSALLGQLLSDLKELGFAQAALNVRADSPAVRLYQRHSFLKIEGSEIRNRTGGISFNMLVTL